jgi:DNA-binding protein HU-beta
MRDSGCKHWECLQSRGTSSFIVLTSHHYLEVFVNKTELLDAISARAGLTRAQSEAALDAVVYEVTAGVRSGDAVRITGFGTFKLRERKARSGRNPQTGAAVKIKASKGIGFTAGTKLKTDLNSSGALAAPAKKAVAKKAVAKKAVAKKVVAKKAVAKKAAPAKKAVAKKVVAKKAVAKKAAPAKKAVAKKVVAKKAVAKKAAPAKKAVAKKVVAKKAVAKKAAPAKKAVAKKVVAKKAVAKKAGATRR